MKKILLGVLVVLTIAVAPIYVLKPKTKSAVQQDASKSVVMLTNPATGGGGTGFMISSKELDRPMLLSNRHVCEITDHGYLIAQHRGEVFITYIEAVSSRYDLCLLSPVKLPALELSVRPLDLFEYISSVGHGQLGPATPVEGSYLGNQIVSFVRQLEPFKTEENCTAHESEIDVMGMRGCLLTYELSLTSVVIYPGNSGSPAIDADGLVVGIFNASDRNTARGAFVPAEHIDAFLRTGE